MRAPGPERSSGARRRLCLTLAGLCCLLALFLGFGGAIARPLDSFAHFRAHLAAAAFLLALLALPLRAYALAAILALSAAGAAVTVAPHLVPRSVEEPEGGGAVYSLLQMNLRWDATAPAEAIRRIADAQADIVSLQEMTPGWRAALAPLEGLYPHQVHCPGADGFRGDSALLSRRPFVAGSQPVCDEVNSFAEARIDFNGIGVSVASHHQLWPWPAGQWRRLDRLRETLRALPAPRLVVGDFNAAPWSAFVQAYAEALDARVVSGIGPVWAPVGVPDGLRRTIGLPLNNAIASAEIGILSAERMESTSSDHLPVLLRFTVQRLPVDGPSVRLVSR